MNHKKYYIELGKLFYAIANADGKIEPKEIAALREIIQNQFVTVEAESDEFGVNDAYYAEFEFETLNEKLENGRRLFTVAAVVDGRNIAEGKAFNKKDASQIAARAAVEKLGIINADSIAEEG